MDVDNIQSKRQKTGQYLLSSTVLRHDAVPLPAVVTAATSSVPKVNAALNYLLFCCVLFAYFISASITLEDYDSVNLAMAVLNFDITLDAPHPPGAPIFVACVKLLHFFVADVPLALSLVAAFGGAVFVSVWHRLFQEFLTEKTATIGAVVLAFSPGLWMTASRPMSDTFAAASLSVAILLALQFAKSRDPKTLLWFSAVLAITVGIRPQFGLLVPFLLFATFVYFRPHTRTIVNALLVFTVINLCWLIPTIASQHDLDGEGWMTYFNQIARFKASFDTASGSPLLANNVQLGDIIFRAVTHLGTLGYFALGLNMWYPEQVSSMLANMGTTLNPWLKENVEWTAVGTLYTFAYILGSLALLPRIRYYWQQAKKVSQPVGYLLLVTIAYSIVVVMLVPPHTRFYIPLLPLFILLPLMGLQSRRWGHNIQYAFMAIAVAASLHTIVDSVSQYAPPIALVKEIQQQTNPTGEGTVLLLNANAARQASWYLKKADIYGGHEKPAPSTPYGIFTTGVRVFSNYPDAFPEQLVERTELGHYHRPYRVWMRHTSTPLYELKLRAIPLAENTDDSTQPLLEADNAETKPVIDQGLPLQLRPALKT